MPPLKAGSRSFRHSRWVGADVHACELVLLAVVLFAVSALGESIEKWKTPSGTLYFGNRPPAGSTLLGGEGTEESPAASKPVGSEPTRKTPSASPSEHIGRVVGIADGDTFTLLVDRQQLRIRLAEIDTPEKGQAYLKRARQALSDMIFDRAVRVVEMDHDRYGRVVGRVYIGSIDVNAEMVRRGAAWVYRKYAKDPSLYELEKEARSARRGIWALPETEQEPPWKWREERRQSSVSSTLTAATPQGPVIGNRRSYIYHRPDCPDYAKVSLNNRVYFDSRAAAEAAGFRQAGNCP